MPSAMIHLNTALAYNNDADILFLIGNLAPDCLDIREFKDRTHFRSSADRAGDLRRLRDATDRDDVFSMGVLLHLFLDYKWDSLTSNEFGKVFFPNGVFAFKYYRDEVHKTSSYLYHNTPGAPELWHKLCGCPPEKYDVHPEFHAKDIREYLKVNAEWNEKIKTPPSDVFLPETVSSFIERSAREFKDFLDKDIL